MAIRIAPELQFDTVVLCEEVRPEPGNKWTVLGAFGGDLVLPSFPVNVRIGIYIEAKVASPYKGPLHIRIRVDNEMIMTVRGELEARVGYLTLPLSSMVAAVPSPGSLHIDASIDDEHWTEVLSRQVIGGTVKDGEVVPITSS